MTGFQGKNIILFDGVCNLCVGSVQFVLKRDTRNLFLFASMQSRSGQEMLRHFNLSADVFNSFLLIESGRVYHRSTAALRVVKNLGGAWPLLFCLFPVPRVVRDGVYDWIARNRYRWFGRKDECWLPTPELKNRFLD
ncbi:MAG: thiol-disulfide oxidoreductase DCC family protein [Bacteroidetes bacterium]|nr:thiol-disulfide oxidoreductase DCC family protein [Bacteroidota bacterium]MCW5895049.1 thiol-disulfide oxidoreductase DCC family protein [Bacteroidota bacterium]